MLKKLTATGRQHDAASARPTRWCSRTARSSATTPTIRPALDSLEQALAEHHGRKTSLDNQTALVLGAGGAAKAIAYRPEADGGQRRRRRPHRRSGPQQLADALKCKTVDWANRYSFQPDLLVNCTPVGMHPNVDATPYDKHHLRPSMVVFDTVYNPENTLLIKDARSQSCTVVTGVEMFVRQACLQFKLFTGQEAPSDLMRDVLKRAIGPAKY